MPPGTAPLTASPRNCTYNDSEGGAGVGKSSSLPIRRAQCFARVSGGLASIDPNPREKLTSDLARACAWDRSRARRAAATTWCRGVKSSPQRSPCARSQRRSFLGARGRLDGPGCQIHCLSVCAFCFSALGASSITPKGTGCQTRSKKLPEGTGSGSPPKKPRPFQGGATGGGNPPEREKY